MRIKLDLANKGSPLQGIELEFDSHELTGGEGTDRVCEATGDRRAGAAPDRGRASCCGTHRHLDRALLRVGQLAGEFA